MYCTIGSPYAAIRAKMVVAHRAELTVTMISRQFKVARSRVYRWLCRASRARAFPGRGKVRNITDDGRCGYPVG